MHASRLVPLLVVVSGCFGGASGAAPRPSELPIRRVILYQNGVGYFERHGRIDGDVLTLQVRPTQVNDILKSLTVIDERDGRAVSVSLPLEKKAADQLAELPEQVRNAGGLLQVFTVFRGARVSLEGGAGTVDGRVVGVEPATGENSDGGYRVTLKTADGALVVYPLGKIERVAIADRTLEVGLDKSLDVALDEGNWKPVGVSVQLAGKTPHELRVSYIAEMPLWKPAYRVVVGKDGALLQGWAVVDNVSGESWNKVALSLVSGSPMSFLYDLHAPQFIRRADLTPHMQSTALAPVIERSGVAMAPPPPAPMASAPAPAYPSAPGMAAPRTRKPSSKARMDSAAELDYASPAEAAAPSYNLAQTLAAQAGPIAQTETVGSLSRYDIADPVDVPDRSSTLVSLVNSKVPGEEVVLVRPEEDRPDVAYAAIKLTNATKVALERGPVAMYADDTFVGESFLDRLEAGTTTFLTYAAEGAVTLRLSRAASEEGSRLLKIHSGMIESEVTSVQKTTYEVHNRRAEDVTVYVKSTRQTGWTLRDPPQGTIEATRALFVPVKVAAGQKAKVELVLSQPSVRTLTIDSDLSTTVLKLFLSSGKAPKELAGAIEQLLKLKARLNDIAAESARVQTQHQTLSADQERLRDNINLLRKTNGNAELMQSLVRKLAGIEEQLGALSGKLVRFSEEQATLESKMRDTIAGISLDSVK